MSKSRPMISLGTQLLAGAFISLLAACLAFGMFYTLGNILLDHTVYGTKFSGRLSKRQFSMLQDYVVKEDISLKKLNRLNAWCSRGDGVYLTLYKDGQLIYESPISRSQRLDPEGFDPEMEDEEREYNLSLSDGTSIQAFLYYFASDSFFFGMVVLSGLLAFAVFSLCFISLVRRKLVYIKKLKKELDILAGGDLTYSVSIQGHDELSSLAYGIDNMRCSILTHQQTEQDIRSANSRLVTAMSHDLRNPLTSLIAYLEILDLDKVSDEKQRKHLIHQSLTQAISIKTLADKLFEYFLVYTTEWEEPQMQQFQADDIMSQFWQEYAFALENQGFQVETDFQELHGNVHINVELLRRAFDNLYTNIGKYAEPSKPVRIIYYRAHSYINLILENTTAIDHSLVESTNIGLNTCQKIIELHNGNFQIRKGDGSLFKVSIQLPIA